MRGGRLALVATTAPGHRAGRLHRGLDARTARRLGRSGRGIGSGMRVVARGSRRAYALRNGRVRYVALAGPALRRSDRRLLAALKVARL